MQKFSIVFLLSTVLFIGCNSARTSSDASSLQSQNDNSNSAEKSSPSPINQLCPIMVGEVEDEGGRAMWKNQLIGFCCPECGKTWAALTDDEKSKKLRKAQVEAEKEQHQKAHHPS